uniref:Uncharacterized protein n=1 Tax=Leptobrachium leishanense TaxID=445787 RepID=A0A8C5MTE0_9ANUR
MLKAVTPSHTQAGYITFTCAPSLTSAITFSYSRLWRPASWFPFLEEGTRKHDVAIGRSMTAGPVREHRTGLPLSKSDRCCFLHHMLHFYMNKVFNNYVPQDLKHRKRISDISNSFWELYSELQPCVSNKKENEFKCYSCVDRIKKDLLSR